MEILKIDAGIKEYDLGFGVPLRVNFSDPNLYDRFMSAADDLVKIQDDMVEEGKATEGGADVLRILHMADNKAKAILNDVFGLNNDFDKLLGGLNLMTVADNGERIITNFLSAITPYMEAGMVEFTDGKVKEAKKNRSQRRAEQK